MTYTTFLELSLISLAGLLVYGVVTNAPTVFMVEDNNATKVNITQPLPAKTNK